MASSYSTDLKIELMVTGENAGTWGDKTNDNLNVIQQAIAGYGEQSIAGGAQTTALTIANSPTLSVARNIVIKLTGTITGNQIVTVPSGIEKTWIVSNGTTGAFTVEFKTTGGTGSTWSTTDKGIKILYSDGTNINAVDITTLSGTVASAQIANLAVTSAKLASFAVTEARLASYAVTTSRLATNAVTAIKIAQSTITQAKLAANSVGSSQLISTGVTPASYSSATITVDADGRITSASSGAAGGLGGQTVYKTAGSGTFTIPSGKTTLKVTVVGGGGGGGPGGYGGNPMNGFPNYGYNSGGAAGGAAVKYLTVTPGNTIAYTVGAAGTAGTGSGNGGAGGTSSISSGNETITTVSSTGGAGGGYYSARQIADGGTGTNGDLNFNGASLMAFPLGNPGVPTMYQPGAYQYGGGQGGASGGSGSGFAGVAGAVIFEY
jgi:hypothetical protein